MGVETAIIAAAAVGGGASIAGGLEQKKAADQQAREIQGIADREATLKKAELQNLLGAQRNEYLHSGVILEGSPQLVLEKTRRLGMLEIQNMRDSAYSQAKAMKRQGRAAMISGIGQGISALAMGAAKGGAA